MRLSIDVTPEQHQRLKAVAALSGQSIKDYVLDRVLLVEADEALQQLEAFLAPRIAAADSGIVRKTVQQIFDDTHEGMR